MWLGKACKGAVKVGESGGFSGGCSSEQVESEGLVERG